MGVANHRSIAWACVQEFLAQNVDCILTHHPRFATHVQRLVDGAPTATTTDESILDHHNDKGRILGYLPCQVEDKHDNNIPNLFQTQLPDVLQGRPLDTIVHSIAYADMENTVALGQATWDAYAQAQHISSYSLIETVQFAAGGTSGNGASLLAPQASVTALSYLGAIRALRPYHIMGPAKAALEANVRGLAAEYGVIIRHDENHSKNDNQPQPADETISSNSSIRVNAVSAGPVATLSSRGIPNFMTWSQQVAAESPLQRLVTTSEIASTVHFLSSSAASGITGQVIYVDGGYSAVVPLAT